MACSCNDPVAIRPSPAQPLHPFVIAPEGAPGCIFTIPPMTVYVFPFWLCPGKSIEINAIQTAMRQQDHTLRLWVADRPLGNPVLPLTSYLNSWKAIRSSERKVTLHETGAFPSKLDYLEAELPSGPYLLHVQNLTNFVNEFSLRLAETGGKDAAVI